MELTTPTITTKPEHDWVICRDGGMWLVGRGPVEKIHNYGPPERFRHLEQAFELHCQVQQQPDGRVGVAYIVQPILLMPSIDRWQLTDGANFWPVKGSSVEKHLRDAIARAEQTAVQMRAAQAGIQIAGAMPRIGGANGSGHRSP